MTQCTVLTFPVPNVVLWPGKRVRETHAALSRAERIHNKTKSEDDWTEVCYWRDEYILACRAEGIDP